jgi:hypothetical protein
MAGIFGRFLRQYFEEVLVNKLSDSKTVQNIAVRGVEATKQAGNALKDPEGIARFASGLMQELKKNAEADMREWKEANSYVVKPASQQQEQQQQKQPRKEMK